MTNRDKLSHPASHLMKDAAASLVVFLVALPLCLGIALASGAPLFSGLLAGIIGGIVVGSLSGSHTSVSGPAAGLTAVVATQIASLGSFEAFLLALTIGGLIQIGLGLMHAGALSAFFPSSVIKGLLAAIGVILILKQIPHMFGHDADPDGEMSFRQPNSETTFSEIMSVMEGDIHIGPMIIGLASIVLLVLWSRVNFLKKSIVPAPLAVVVMGVVMQLVFQRLGGVLTINPTHLVQIPVAETANDLFGFFRFPDFSQWANSAIYIAALTLAIVASLETLLNLEAADKLDPLRRNSPPSRELIAQGTGNILAGLIGGLPVTSVVVRSSVNVAAGAKTKRSAILHGVLLSVCVVFLPVYLNSIPLACLAAILFITGLKLANPSLFRQMWQEGRYQFTPFLLTLLAIVMTDLLVGILVGLAISLLFILNSNLRRPIHRIVESHVGGKVLHIELANQVSFLNRAALDRIFNDAQRESHLLLDARQTDYIDPDILSLIREFKNVDAPQRGVTVSLRGFRKKYQLHDQIQFVDYSTRELRDRISPQQVLEILREGNQRFRTGERLSRDLDRQVGATSHGQHPLAVVLGCIDSRVPSELVFDLGIGDIFNVRVAGNVIGTKSLGSIEYGVAIAGVKLVLVMGHTRCGAVTSAIQILSKNQNVEQATGCQNLQAIISELQLCVTESELRNFAELTKKDSESFIDEIAKRNVFRIVNEITARSEVIRNAATSRRILIAGALYDVKTGTVEILLEDSQQQEVIEYLRTENTVLKEKFGKKRVLPTDGC